MPLKYSSWFILLLFCCSCQSYKPQIRKQLNGMEEAWASEEFKKIAQFYTDDAYLLSGKSVVAQGEQEVIEYWSRTKATPIGWTLTDWVSSPQLEDIYQHPKWAEAGTDMPMWTDHDIAVPDDVIYQLGESILVSHRNEKADSSIVSFLLVWKKTDEGYKIFVDAYN